jgi:hypothetical protein
LTDIFFFGFENIDQKNPSFSLESTSRRVALPQHNTEPFPYGKKGSALSVSIVMSVQRGYRRGDFGTLSAARQQPEWERVINIRLFQFTVCLTYDKGLP